MLTKQRKRTLLGQFHRSELRREFAKCGPDYLDSLDSIALLAANWRPTASIDEIDADWVADFELHLRSLPLEDSTRKTYLRNLRRIARQLNPYRFLGSRMSWRTIEPFLRRERTGCFGHYYVTTFEKKHPGSRVQTRTFVKDFVCWCERPIELDQIDNVLLEGFGQEYGLKAAARIRLIVNTWAPDRLPTRRERPLPKHKLGTVQNFVCSLIDARRAQGKRPNHTNDLARVGRRLDAFCSGRGLPFSKFTPDFCVEFLRWCLTSGNEGQPLERDDVNLTHRYTLGAICRAAVDAGKMKHRFVIPPLFPLQSERKTSRNSRKSRSTNPKIETPPRPAQIKPQWAPESGELQFGNESYAIAKQAKRIRDALSAFEAAGWIEKIPTVCPENPQAHKDVIRGLKKCRFLTFTSALSGTAIAWKPTPA